MGSATEFLDLLAPNVEPWRASFERWIFRGHGCASYKLLPTAYRKELWDDFKVRSERFDPLGVQPRELELEERFILKQFFDRADASGLAIPLDSARLRNIMSDDGNFGVWPEADVRPLLAWARHHGLPTRLLDWTWDGRVAAYFAAADAVRFGDVDGDLEVIALDAKFLRDTGRDASPTSYTVYCPPRASNPNLHAQSGVLTFCQYTAWVTLAAFDDVVLATATGTEGQRLIGTEVSLPRDGQLLQRFTLPKRLAADLLRLLGNQRITGATMFPSADGVVQSLKEQARWRHPGLRLQGGAV